MKFNPAYFSHQTGLTLVELMVALAIGFVGVASVGYLYVGSQQSFRIQDSMSTIQENSRFALDTMSQGIRMAGYAGCGNLSSVALNNITANPQVVTPGGATGIQVFPAGSGWTVPTGYVRVAGDVLRLSYASSAGVTVTGNMANYTANIQINGNPSGFTAGSVLMVSDCQNADLFVTTGVSSSSGTVTIAHASNANTSNTLSTLYGLSSPPAQVYSFLQTDYFVGCPTASWSGGACSVPEALYQVINNGTPLALVDDVENMYFLLGNGPNAVTGYLTAANVTNWANVLSVQVHLLVVGAPAYDSASNVTVASQAYTFNGVTYPADRRLRQEVITTVGIRNRLP